MSAKNIKKTLSGVNGPSISLTGDWRFEALMDLGRRSVKVCSQCERVCERDLARSLSYKPMFLYCLVRNIRGRILEPLLGRCHIRFRKRLV